MMMMREPDVPVGLDFGLDRQELPLRVLVLESRPNQAAPVREMGVQAGIQVEFSRYPNEALEKLDRETYDVLLIDLPLLDMSPEELYRQLVAGHPEQLAHTVFLTSDLRDPATRKFLTEAGRPFLTQPVEPHELFDLVMRVGHEEDQG